MAGNIRSNKTLINIEQFSRLRIIRWFSVIKFIVFMLFPSCADSCINTQRKKQPNNTNEHSHFRIYATGEIFDRKKKSFVYLCQTVCHQSLGLYTLKLFHCLNNAGVSILSQLLMHHLAICKIPYEPVYRGLGRWLKYPGNFLSDLALGQV